MEIKICGIRRVEDVEIVNKYKPDYIGFIFAESKRYISPERALELRKYLDRDIKTVGVFVNETQEKIRRTADMLGLDVVQLHGDENEEYMEKLDVKSRIWKAVRMRDGADIPDVTGADMILLDKFTKAGYGGIGKSFDWSAVGEIRTSKPLILAGGLNKDNVKKGIEIFNPVCVDVSSSVETNGFKDDEKIREFINTVRESENEQNR